MRIQTAMKQLQALLGESPETRVTIRKIKQKKVKRKHIGITRRLYLWALKRKKFTFLEAVRSYERIGGSAGTTTVLHRLKDIRCRPTIKEMSDSHLKQVWISVPDRESATDIKEAIAKDPGFEERYEAERRAMLARGQLAPPALSTGIGFRKSWGSDQHGMMLEPLDPDRERTLRVKVMYPPEVVTSIAPRSRATGN